MILQFISIYYFVFKIKYVHDAWIKNYPGCIYPEWTGHLVPKSTENYSSLFLIAEYNDLKQWCQPKTIEFWEITNFAPSWTNICIKKYCSANSTTKVRYLNISHQNHSKWANLSVL